MNRPRRRSPLDALIDKACGYTEPEPPEPRSIATEDEKADAASVASDVIMHITDMYPRVWDNVPKTARVSIRNTVHNRVVALLLSRANSVISKPAE